MKKYLIASFVFITSLMALAQQPPTGIAVTGKSVVVTTITAPTSSSTYDNSTGATITTVAGTAQSNQAITGCTWTNSGGGSGSTTGTTSWSIPSISLAVGSNVVTVTCTSSSSVVGVDTVTVTRSSASGSVTWIDTAAYTKPAFVSVTMPSEAAATNKYYVSLSSGSGSTCSQASPCSMDGVLGKAGTTGTAGTYAYIYIKGTGSFSWFEDTIKGGGAGFEVVVKPWPAGTTGCVAECLATVQGGSNMNSSSGNIQDMIWDGGPNLNIKFSATVADGNAFTMVVNAHRLKFYRVQGTCATNPSAGTFAFGSQYINQNIYIINSEFYGCNTGSGYQASALYASPGATGANLGFNGMYVYNNIIRQQAGEAIEINPRGTSDNLEIVGNAIYDVGKKSIGTSFGCRAALVLSIQSGGGTNHSLIANNIIWDTCSGCFWDRGSGTTPTQFINNTCYQYNVGNNSDPWPQGVAGFSNSGSAVVRNNIIYDPEGTAAFDGGGYTKSNNICSSTTSCGTSSLAFNTSTTLVSTTVNDAAYLTIGSGSNAVNAGTTVAAVTSSYGGVARATYDIGAFEYAAPPPPPPPSAFLLRGWREYVAWATQVLDTDRRKGSF